jgi:hypothetical protein
MIVALFARLWKASKKVKSACLSQRLLTFLRQQNVRSKIAIFKIKIRERTGKRHYLLEKG